MFNSKEEDRIQFAKKQEPIIHQLLCNNSDIVLSHLPPFGVLDKVTSEFAPESWINKNAGNKMIIDYIQNFKPKYVFCGHIHEGYGQEKVENTIVCNMGLAKYKVIDIWELFY